jgi:hypothetical protein
MVADNVTPCVYRELLMRRICLFLPTILLFKLVRSFSCSLVLCVSSSSQTESSYPIPPAFRVAQSQSLNTVCTLIFVAGRRGSECVSLVQKKSLKENGMCPLSWISLSVFLFVFSFSPWEFLDYRDAMVAIAIAMYVRLFPFAENDHGSFVSLSQRLRLRNICHVHI